MAFNLAGPLNRIVAILTGLSGMQTVYTGVPESIGTRVSAYVTLGGMRVADKATQLLQREQRYFVAFAYRVSGAEATAEADLMTMVDAFIAAIYADRTLNGTAKGVTIDAGLADQPEYRVLAGQEFRVYPIVVGCTQQNNP